MPTWLAVLINAEINNQLFYSIKLVNIMSKFTRLFAKTDIIDHAIFCRIHDVCNICIFSSL